MASKHITEDEINFLVNAKVSQAQQEIRKFEKDVSKLEDRNRSLRKQMDSLELAGKKDTESWKKRRAEYGKNVQEIKRLKQAIAEETNKLDINSLSMAQLKKQSKDLQKQLDNTAKAIHPEEYDKLQKQLTKVNGRMNELKETSKGLKESFLDETTFSFLKGSVFVKLGELVGQAASYAVGKVKEMVNEGIEMAKTADGITHAFERMNRPDILDNLREATHGTVNDVELMKAAVQAKDFRLPLDQLGKYLEFAQLKASQTGQSVDYMTQSIITGLGRKSLMILDNLGISAAQVKEEMAKGGDMATAVGRIIEQQLAAQGEHYEDAAEREKRAITEVQNAQKELGDEMLPLAEKGSSMWLMIQVAALKLFTYLVRAFKQGVAGFVDLYNSSATVRAGVAILTTNFKTLWAAIKFGANFTITALKTIGKQVLNLGKMVEGVLTLDFDKIKEGFTGIFTDAWSGLKDQWKNFEQLGNSWGNSLIKGFNDVVDGHITAPSFDSGGGGSSVPLPDSNPESPTPSSDKPQKAKKVKDTTAAEDRERMKALKQARQKELDEQKYFYEESVRIYKKQLADKQISQEQFDAIMANLQVAQADRQVATEKAYLEKIKQMEFKSADLRKAAITEQERNILKAENDSYNARTVAYQKYQDNLQQLENGGMNSLERMEYEHQLQLKSLEGYYKASLQYAQEHNEELLSIDLAYQQAKEKLEKDYTEKLEQEKFQIRQQYGLVTQAELYEQQKEQLLQQYEEGLLNEEEYQQALKQLKMDYWKQTFDYYHQLFSDAVNALMEAEMANVDAKYDAEIDAARKAGKDTTELENKKANEKLKIEKKYADVQFAVKASEIIANTAMAIMTAFAQLGPIGGAIAAAMLSVTGIAQLAVANAERQKVKRMTLNGAGSSGSGGARVATGREEGGWLDVEREQDGKRFHAKYDPKKRGYVNQPTVIVGEGPRPKEWIASNEAVENPTIAPFINVIDRVQRAGQLRTFDFNKYLRRQQAQGYADGGSISNRSPMQPQAQRPADTADLKRLADVLERIDRDGVPAYLGFDEFDAKQNVRNRSRNLAKKG